MEHGDVKVNDWVTVALRFGTPTVDLARAIVTNVWEEKGEFDVIAAHDDRAWTAGRKLANEGVDWCRGHSGPEVDALAVARALT